MDAYGLAGLGAGIAEGVDKATQGMVQAESIKQGREQMRQQAEYKNAQLKQMEQQSKQTDLNTEVLAAQVKQLKSQMVKQETYSMLDSYSQTGDSKYLNMAIQNPEFAKFAPNTARIESVDATKDADLLARSGIKPEALEKDPKRYVRAIGKDGSEVVADMYGVYGLTGYLSYMRKDQLEVMKLASAKAEVTQQENKADQSTIELELYQNYIDKNPNATIADLKAAIAKRSETKPSDVQSAEYFGGLASKPNRTPQEDAILEQQLMKQGGTEAARNFKVTKSIDDLNKSGIDLNSPDFDLNKLSGEKRKQAEVTIRDLSTTSSGKKLEANIAKKLGDGLGAVQATASKLTDLADKQDVSTNMVRETVNQVKSYLPEELRDMSDEDLKDAKFRQAYLASAAVFLKLQSGLTVSEKEAERFSQSFGTLNKNIKVNMTGLKTKLDEVISDYEINKDIEPTLYNAKYAKTIKGMKSTSAQLESFISGKPSEQPAGSVDYRVVQDASGKSFKQYRDGRLEPMAGVQ